MDLPTLVVGFLDQHDIELGEEWEKTSTKALQESKMMVCIYSPGYFKSSYCGKEWEVFQRRRDEYIKQRKAPGEKDPSLPPVIKPVFWLAPLPTNLNEAIKATQYITGDPADYHMYGVQPYHLLICDALDLSQSWIEPSAAAFQERA